MLPKWSLAVPLLSALSASSSPFHHDYHRFAPRQTTLSWAPCYANPLLECAIYEPPLDYANPAAGKARLAVIKYKATKTPRLGTLFSNPGGPGGSGVGFIIESGELISNWTGGFYDVVSWDPRGVNNSLPAVRCFQDAFEEATFWGLTLPRTGIEAQTGFNDTVDVTYFYSQLSRTDDILRRLGQRCLQASGDALKYVGSVATTRDLVGLADAVGGPSLPINYLGFSYGTLIGTYFVNMFPNRVGRVVLDGMINPQIYSAGPAHKITADQFQDTEKVLQEFFDQCSAAGSRCSMSRGTTGTLTPTQIRVRMLNLIQTVYEATRLGLDLGTEVVRVFIFSYMYLPRYWEDLADELVAAEQQLAAALGPGFSAPAGGTPVAASDLKPPTLLPGRPPISVIDTNMWYLKNRDEVYDFLRLPLGSDTNSKRQVPTYAPSDYSNIAISCSDGIDAGSFTTKDVFDEIIRVSREVSPVFGPTFQSAGYYCHHWPARASERYSGPWNSKLANPILVIGNRADPVTPLASAKFVADQLGDSAVLIEHNGVGHLSVAMFSSCTNNLVSNYFISGSLPTSDTTCQTNETLFVRNDTRRIPLATSFSPVTLTPLPTSTGTSAASATAASGSNSNSELARKTWVSLSSAYSVVLGLACFAWVHGGLET